MPKKGYKAITVPEELYILIQEVVKSKKYGYRSVSEFVKDAIRRRLNELGYMP